MEEVNDMAEPDIAEIGTLGLLVFILMAGLMIIPFFIIDTFNAVINTFKGIRNSKKC